MAACLPWWHALFQPYRARRTVVASGCPTSGGNVTCAPEAMRAQAETYLRQTGVWPADRPFPLTAYTLARYIASEVGTGTVEEKYAVGEAAINRVRLEGLRDVNDLLLYRQREGHPNRGWYGPIHGSGDTAPYGRWASTARDPGVDDLLIAGFLLGPEYEPFNRGGDNQFGPAAGVSLGRPILWAIDAMKRRAERRDYWVGPLPGVNHQRTFIFARRAEIHPASDAGQALIAAAEAALKTVAPNWMGLDVCPRRASPPSTVARRSRAPIVFGVTALLLGGATLAYWLTTRTRWG